ncbi:MAG: T9SS type A sorting domain-containing protein, partial [Elusimicrobia bacterium]|nr:T9SS type A sorting domain-containing protein [Elusimicrobiota bacterium]
PPNTFNQNVSLTASMTSVPSSDRETIKITNIGIEVTTDKNAQPDKAITITMYYRDSDIAGLDESKLVICRYDSTNNLWTPLPSTVYPDQNKVVAQTDHLSKFVLVQLAPAANLGSIKVYPNPLNSKLYSMTIANLTATADIKIYNVAGELVRKLDYSTGNGQVIWDGKNDGGSLVASGVYIIYINSPQGTKKIKVAIEK